MSARVLARLAPLTRRQFGVFTTRDAATVGVGRQDIVRLLETRLAERLWRATYALTTAADTWQRRWYAAMRAAGSDAAISHRAAAYLWGLEHVGVGQRPDLALVRPGREASRGGGPPTHTALHLRPADVTTTGPWRLTDVAWTLCSLAHRLGPERLRRGVDAAVASGTVEVDAFAAAGRRFACCPGASVIREVAADLVPEVRGTRSDPERRFLRLLKLEGLPLPEADVRVIDASGHVRFLDFAYRSAGIAIEIDVHPDHHGTIGRRLDGARQNDLVLDWVPLRFDAEDLARHPGRVAAVVRRALARASERPEGPSRME